MFGYITVNTAALTEEQKLRYRAHYCGLCRTLHDRYGQTGRLALSNDITFLSVLLSSLYEPAHTEGSGPCVMHPLQKRGWVRSAAADYAADMNHLLAYFKCLDNANDDGDLLQGQLARRMEKDVLPFAAKYPRQWQAVREALDGITALEKAGSDDIDALCRLSGRLLSEVFVWKDDAFAPALRALGSALGAFIYLMDAYEDYDADVKKNRFNPLRAVADREDREAIVEESLLMFAAGAAQAADLLPLIEDEDLIHHVLYQGIWTRWAWLHRKDEAPEPAPGCGEDNEEQCQQAERSESCEGPVSGTGDPADRE